MGAVGGAQMVRVAAGLIVPEDPVGRVLKQLRRDDVRERCYRSRTIRAPTEGETEMWVSRKWTPTLTPFIFQSTVFLERVFSLAALKSHLCFCIFRFVLTAAGRGSRHVLIFKEGQRKHKKQNKKQVNITKRVRFASLKSFVSPQTFSASHFGDLWFSQDGDRQLNQSERNLRGVEIKPDRPTAGHELLGGR